MAFGAVRNRCLIDPFPFPPPSLSLAYSLTCSSRCRWHALFLCLFATPSRS